MSNRLLLPQFAPLPSAIVESQQRWRWSAFGAMLMMASIATALCIMERAAEAREHLVIANLSASATLYAEHWSDGNGAAMRRMTSPLVAEIWGGSKPLMEHLHRRREELRRSKWDQVHVSGFAPVNTRNEKEWVAFGEITMESIRLAEVLAVGGRHPHGEWRLIAVSNDQGKSWQFIPTSPRKADVIRKRFPSSPW